MSLPIDPLTVCTVGITGVLVGLGLLVWPWKQQQQSWRVPLVSGLALSGLGAGLAVGRADVWLVGPALALGAIGMLLALLRSGLIGWLERALARPISQSAVLMIAGLGLLVAGIYGIDRDTQRDLNSTADLFKELWYRQPSRPISNVSARTDQGRAVTLHAPTPGDEIKGPRPTSRRGSGARTIQTGPPDPGSNCHGWVFTGGRYLVSGHDVELILADNGYLEVKGPQPGDVAIYRDTTGFATHTALVCGLGDKGAVLMESKWGQGARFIHTATDHPYSRDAVTYYRSDRGSHTLAGIGAAPPEVGAAE